MQYRVIDFLMNNEIYIHEDAQTAPGYPLTMNNAKPFFDHFKDESFQFEGIVKSIFIFSGKYYPQGTSFAHGYLHPQSIDDIKTLPEHSEFAASILFEYRENDLLRIRVGDPRHVKRSK
jgi:hypothetical protein